MKLVAISAAALLVFAVAPASAKPMACTGANMAKTTSSMTAMPETPTKMAMAKEMSKVNAAMSKGKMRDACASYMKAQKVASAK
jgi:hypothetical protein